MTCDLSTLLSETTCMACLPAETQKLIELALLCRIQQKITTLPCDLETLLQESSEFQSVPPGERELIALSLLCRISTGT